MVPKFEQFIETIPAASPLMESETPEVLEETPRELVRSVVITGLRESSGDNADDALAVLFEGEQWSLTGLLAEDAAIVTYRSDSTTFLAAAAPEGVSIIVEGTYDTIHKPSMISNLASRLSGVENAEPLRMISESEVFEDLMEARTIVVKRKYTERHPSRSVGADAPTRLAVLEYLDQKGGRVSRDEIKAYFSELRERENSPNADFSWLSKNKTLVERVRNSSGEVEYKLTKEGRRVLEKHRRSSSKTSEISE